MDWIHQLIEPHSDKAPAILDHDGRRYSYGEMRAMVDTATQALRAHGVRPGDRVMIVAENCALYPITVFACSRLKAWANPVNARMSHDELEAIRNHSEARAMVFTAPASDEAKSHATAYGASDIATLPCGALSVSPVFNAAPEPVEDDPKSRVAALLYTSGTTSAPKGVMLTHANMCWNAQASARLRRMAPEDRVIGILPGTHIFGFASTMLATFHTGSEMQFITRFSVPAMLDALEQGGAVMPAVPQMYAHLLAWLDRNDRPLKAPKLHYISAGGAPLDPDLKRRTEAAFGLPLRNGMGMTETSPTALATSHENPDEGTSVGKAVPDVTIWLDSADENGVGELMVRGPNVMKGYYRNPEATAAVLQDGAIHTGDLARIDENGMVHIVGRLKELIIRSGFNVYPPEVEAMLTKHPALEQAAVVGRPVPGNEEIVAFVIARAPVTGAEIKEWLHQHLAAYKVPQHVFVVDAFPAAATGKILKHKLLDHFAALLPGD